MKEINKIIGKVSISPKGYWNENNNYEVLDLVTEPDSKFSYIAKQNVPISIPLSNQNYWMRISSGEYVKVFLDGSITIGENGNWFQNGIDTGYPAKGEKGLTPIIKIINNKFNISYDLEQTWSIISDPVITIFRWNKLNNSSNIGIIQSSTDNGNTWNDLSSEFINNLFIKNYVESIDNLPENAVTGEIYAVGPIYKENDSEHLTPFYELYVYINNKWNSLGSFNSIHAGIVDNFGDSQTEIISQKGITELIGVSEYKEFNEFDDFFTGEVVQRNGKLYKFIIDHIASPWDNGHVEETSIIKNILTKEKIISRSEYEKLERENAININIDYYIYEDDN